MKTFKTPQQLKDEWFAENAPLGKLLGYPDCCIKEFCDMPPAIIKKTTPNKDDQRRLKSAYIQGVYSGFIPCAAHAKQIVMGKITAASLIENRDPEFPPFPRW